MTKNSFLEEVTFKKGWNRKEGRGNKDFKKEERQAGSSQAVREKGGCNPFINYG